MAWPWWRYCCCCWRSDVLLEDEAAVCSTSTSSASHLSLGSASSQDSTAMGQTASRIKDFLHKQKPVTPPPEDDSHNITPKPLSDHHINSSEVVGTSSIPSHSSSLPKFPLATPRSPLRRVTRPLTPSESSPGKPPSKRLKGDIQYLDFPFLVDDKTIRFVQGSKVMFIMKGIPGSGKTFITKEIKEVYEDAVLCSADHYFMKNGKYHFEVEKLKDAHQSCQEAAHTAAEENCHVIVIDNTNLRHWEMKFYLNLAREHCYIPLVVEPQTPWVMDCRELARRNAHDLPGKSIAQKIKIYQPLLPIYYGWFLNEEDSKQIGLMGRMWLQEAINVDDFIQDFSQNTQLTTTEDIFKYFSLDKYVDECCLLHATAKFTLRGRPEGAMEYITNSLVKSTMGRCFKLHIIGFVITPRTFGARVRLTEDQLEVWGNDDYEDPPASATHWGAEKKYDREAEKLQEEVPDMEREGEQTIFENVEKTAPACRSTISVIDAELKEDRFHPTWGKGSRAHLTLAFAPGVKPVNTGFDLINVIRCEQRVREEEWLTESELCEQKVETYRVKGGMLRTYGEGSWVLYPEKEIVVTSMFSAFY